MIDRILSELDGRGMDQGELESAAALTPGRITRWKKGTGEPSASQSARMADELGVSLEWLVTGRGDRGVVTRPPDLTSDEVALLSVFRASHMTLEEAVERLNDRRFRKAPRKHQQG